MELGFYLSVSISSSQALESESLRGRPASLPLSALLGWASPTSAQLEHYQIKRVYSLIYCKIK